MDTEEGVEVVWNEVKFSERKNFKAKEEKIREVFDSLAQLEHPNIVKIHKYWMDKDSEKPRVIFITEYMSSGSLKQFLKKTKRNWHPTPSTTTSKRFEKTSRMCTFYLHSCSPPILHGNMTCDTIFIQHNGLIKIGSGSSLHRLICHRFCVERHKHFRLVASWRRAELSMVTPAADIYSFGMCALEMAALEIPGNGDSGTQITEDVVNKTIESLENVHQKDFIRKCLRKSPQERPTARELLFHPVIFEVHALQVLAAHVIVKSASYHPDQLTDEAVVSRYSQADVIAEISHRDGRDGVALRKNEVPKLELEKLLEDVRNGIYPLTAFVMSHQPIVRPRASSPEVSESVQSASPEPFDAETRRIINMMCNIKQQEESQNFVMTLLLRMDDKMNRQLTCELSLKDTPSVLVTELVHYGFINKDDRNMVEVLIQDTLSRSHIPGIPNPGAPLSVGAA
ncbi:nuclear receptor-binding protein, putative [Ixodes scapularis]|uniref:Nuclear receptor-binding protein, putative n=1 Tax=Ixodes scapularis TaxID=6945 RepID=B7QHF0_IXOSC|nr:nuclear receptor-binding protein, putative [Ixodes scapularis]|eukprot:XP_002414607.1 nuclear receptor-binding protein, putative [Ixodes scapularis]